MCDSRGSAVCCEGVTLSCDLDYDQEAYPVEYSYRTSVYQTPSSSMQPTVGAPRSGERSQWTIELK